MVIWAVPLSLAACIVMSLATPVHAGSASTPLEVAPTSDNSYAHPDFQVVAPIFRSGIDKLFACHSTIEDAVVVDLDEDMCPRAAEFILVLTEH